MMGNDNKVRLDAAVNALSRWVNQLTGQGTSIDKSGAARWTPGAALQPDLLDALWHNDLCRSIVCGLPEWGLRHGWDLTLEAAGAVEAQSIESAVRAKLDELGAHKAQLEAACWGQHYGGALILIGARDGRLTSEPLDVGRLRSIDYLRAVDRGDVEIEHHTRDPSLARLGEPLIYVVTADTATGGSEMQRWHHSRVLRYGGAMTPRRARRDNGGWDWSVLDDVLRAVEMNDAMWANTGGMLADASQGVWKIKGFFNTIMSGKLDQIEARLSIADRVKSVFRSIMLDADGESFDFVHREFGSIPELLAQSAIRTAAAARMPVTVLYGQSPAGLNATGESDIRLWYDRVEQYQEDALRAPLERLVSLLLLAADGPTRGKEPESWRVTWRPVRKETPMEAGELRARQAQVDAAYITAGVATADEVAVSRFTTQGWSSATQIDMGRRRAALLAATGPVVAPAVAVQVESTGPAPAGATAVQE